MSSRWKKPKYTLLDDQTLSIGNSQNVIDGLTCSSCFKFLCRPVYECPFQHSICGVCHERLGSIVGGLICGSCYRGEYTRRNKIAEDLCEAILINCDYGCGMITTCGNITAHQKLCPKGPVSCNIGNYCSEQYHPDKMLEHLRNSHALIEKVEGIDILEKLLHKNSCSEFTLEGYGNHVMTSMYKMVHDGQSFVFQETVYTRWINWMVLLLESGPCNDFNAIIKMNGDFNEQESKHTLPIIPYRDHASFKDTRNHVLSLRIAEWLNGSKGKVKNQKYYEWSISVSIVGEKFYDALPNHE